jgi:formylglycine-generating enzyme required for sulfatase activity
VTVGVFNDAAQRDAELLNLLFSLNTGKAGNKGPSVWERNTNKDGILPSRPGGWDTSGWLFDVPSLSSAKVKPYPDELIGAVGTPSALHPMQQVSSTVASRVAGKIGCRLPTAEEWKAAAEMSSSADARTPNRRDATWDAYKVYLDGQFKNLAGGPPMDAPWPDKGSFDPKKTNTGPKAVAAVAGNDQVLWFREVGGPDGRFHDLVGNAAEWVAPAGPSAGQTPNDVARAQVIGASAISSDQIAPDIAQDPTNRTRAAFSDVGFRLAFDAVGGTAPAAEPLIARLKKAADAIALAK